MATTSRSAAARLVSLIVSALLLVGASLLSVTPKAYAATPGTISGTVLDSVSGLPLAGVAVATVGSPTSATTTDGSGAYTLSLDAGAYALSAALDGYAPKTSPQITVADGASVSGVNFTLQKYATVRGTVTNSSGGGIGQVVIKLYDATTGDHPGRRPPAHGGCHGYGGGLPPRERHLSADSHGAIATRRQRLQLVAPRRAKRVVWSTDLPR